MSKGWAQRPLGVPREQFNDNWDKIFGKNKDQGDRKVELGAGLIESQEQELADEDVSQSTYGN